MRWRLGYEMRQGKQKMRTWIRGCDPGSIGEEPETRTTIAEVKWAHHGGVYPQLPPWKFDLRLQAN